MACRKFRSRVWHATTDIFLSRARIEKAMVLTSHPAKLRKRRSRTDTVVREASFRFAVVSPKTIRRFPSVFSKILRHAPFMENFDGRMNDSEYTMRRIIKGIKVQLVVGFARVFDLTQISACPYACHTMDRVHRQHRPRCARGLPRIQSET